MVKLLPEVLLNLSKISATVHIAIPILEFLSTLTQLPKVFANFVGDQYMSVFAYLCLIQILLNIIITQFPLLIM